MAVYISKDTPESDESVLPSSTVIRFKDITVKHKMAPFTLNEYDDRVMNSGSGFFVTGFENDMDSDWSYNFGCGGVDSSAYFCLEKPGLDTVLMVGFSIMGPPAFAAVVLKVYIDSIWFRSNLGDRAKWHKWNEGGPLQRNAGCAGWRHCRSDQDIARHSRTRDRAQGIIYCLF